MIHVQSKVYLGKQIKKIPKLIEALGIYVLCAAISYLILIFLLGHFSIPVFIDDFNRSIMFLTAILAVIYYKEDLKEVLMICFAGPFGTYILAIIPALFIWSRSPSEQVWTEVMTFFTFSSFYIVYAGFVGVSIYMIAVWISGFLSSHSPTHSSNSKKSVFSVIDKRAEINDIISKKEDSNTKPHTKNQVIGFLISVIILLNLTILLFILPFYNYSFDLHLTIWDLGLIPVLLVGFVIIDLISIILVIAIWHFNPPLMQKYPSSMIGIQSKLAAISIFFASIFFPNPSSIRVGTFVVENSIGIEILTYAILLIIIFTPAICEYLQPLKTLSYKPKVNTSSNLNSGF